MYSTYFSWKSPWLKIRELVFNPLIVPFFREPLIEDKGIGFMYSTYVFFLERALIYLKNKELVLFIVLFFREPLIKDKGIGFMYPTILPNFLERALI